MNDVEVITEWATRFIKLLKLNDDTKTVEYDDVITIECPKEHWFLETPLGRRFFRGRKKGFRMYQNYLYVYTNPAPESPLSLNPDQKLAFERAGISITFTRSECLDW
jgi:hypothetical protein